MRLIPHESSLHIPLNERYRVNIYPHVNFMLVGAEREEKNTNPVAM